MRIERQGRVDALNARLHERLRPPGVPAYDIKGFNAQYYTIGDPVMWLRNDYSRGFFSGLIGQEDLMDLTLAHAITCHKLQGSQAARAVAPIYESRLLDPSWVYTAITPAERQVIIFWATWPCCTWFSKGPGLPKIAGRIRVAAPR